MKIAIRSDAPTSWVRDSDIPNVRSRYSAVLQNASVGMSFGGKGYLIGMLGLTYTRANTIGAQSFMAKSDDVPRVKIRKTD